MKMTTSKWMVSAAITLTGKSLNRETCFKLNAIDIATEAEAKAEAKRRNAIERKAGHTNVNWYPSPMLDIAALMRGMK
jgi:hypothetical protein